MNNFNRAVMASCPGILKLSLIAVVFLLAAQLAAGEANAGSASGIVAPGRADFIASPLTFRTIQTTTEADNAALFADQTANALRVRTGLDTYLGRKIQLYDVPVLVAFNPDMQVQLNVPLVTASTSSFPTGGGTETGIGDVRLSFKFRTDIESPLESYYIFTLKLPTGNQDLGLGTGSYDLAFTHKSIATFGSYRTTFMAGVTLPLGSKVTVAGDSVDYAPTVAYMVATERDSSRKGLHYCLKAAGFHAFTTKVNTVSQHNGLTTLDIIPEVSYQLSTKRSVRGGLILPLITSYDLPGASNTRAPSLNLAFFQSF